MSSQTITGDCHQIHYPEEYVGLCPSQTLTVQCTRDELARELYDIIDHYTDGLDDTEHDSMRMRNACAGHVRLLDQAKNRIENARGDLLLMQQAAASVGIVVT